MKKYFIILFTISLPFSVQGQDIIDSTIIRLSSYIQNANNFSKFIPQEQVYLHLDNNCYYKGDNIWFKGYIVNTQLYTVNALSKTLYVDLLNPGGEIIDKKILKIEDGQCHGDFTLNNTVFYPGFYEIRAYTKYMLNFGEDVIFSRLIPVFNPPKEEGNFREMTIKEYRRDIQNKRPKLKKEKKVNLRFFPEGGNLIEGLESRVAFCATDEYGTPIKVTGKIINKEKQELSRFETTHEGKGLFSYTPKIEKHKVSVRYKEKDYQFDLPQSLPNGYMMKVDNISQPDSIEIAIQKNTQAHADILGLAIMCRGKIYKF